MIKRTAVIFLIMVIAFGSFGCSKGNDQGQMSKKDLVMTYNSLNSRYIEILDYYQALQNKKISKFDWRIIADSSKNQCQRFIKMLKSSNEPVGKELIGIAQDINSLTQEMEGYVDHGTKPDLSYKQKIEAQLEKVKPEIEQLKQEVINEQK